MGARALAAIGDRIAALASLRDHACANPRPGRVRSSLLLAGATARVYHSANIWPRPRPVFSGQIISVAGKEEVQRECSREVAEGALMERSDLADKALRVEARTCERFTTATRFSTFPSGK